MITQDKIFNMDVAHLEYINELLKSASEASKEGNNLQWYRILKSIWRAFHFKVLHDPKNKDEIEDEVSLMFKKCENHAYSQRLEVQDLILLERSLDALEDKLIQLLYSYDMIYLKKRTSDPNNATIEGLFGVQDG